MMALVEHLELSYKDEKRNAIAKTGSESDYCHVPVMVFVPKLYSMVMHQSWSDCQRSPLNKDSLTDLKENKFDMQFLSNLSYKEGISG